MLSRLSGELLTGLALAAAGGGRLLLREDQREQLVEAHRTVMMWDLWLERRLLELDDAFRAEGIEVVVLKGPSVAHTAYPDPALRPFRDLDLLVRTSDWRRACALLAGMGWPRGLPEPRPGFDERFGKGAVYLTEDGQEIDLHRTLTLGPFGLWLDPDELFEHTAPLWIGGRCLRRLDDTALLMHVAIHAALGLREPMVLPVRDVAQVAAVGAVGWNVMADWAGRWRLGVVFRYAFTLASKMLGVAWPVDGSTALTAPAGRTERRALEAYVTDRRSRGGIALATMRAIPGVLSKAAYARDLLVPRREFVTGRQRRPEHSSYLRRLMVPAGWVTGRKR
jgi:hypothetical protein